MNKKDEEGKIWIFDDFDLYGICIALIITAIFLIGIYVLVLMR